MVMLRVVWMDGYGDSAGQSDEYEDYDIHCDDDEGEDYDGDCGDDEEQAYGVDDAGDEGEEMRCMIFRGSGPRHVWGSAQNEESRPPHAHAPKKYFATTWSPHHAA